MSRIAYVNGRYVRHGDAAVHVEDRGYQFADGVYEVIAVRRGVLIDAGLHLDRLDRSLRELDIAAPMSRAALGHVIGQVIRRNRVADGIVYLQVTRGVARRDHPYPAGVAPALVVTARRGATRTPAMDNGVAVITIEDIRWKRCDIKSISLLPNVLGKQQAVARGAYEAWLVADDGTVTEGTSTNAWIVTPDDELVTRQANRAILNGVTRRAVLALAEDAGLRFVERPFTVAEALDAREAFLTSTTSYVIPVTRIDGRAVGDGTPGPLTRRLQAAYRGHVAEGAGAPATAD